LDGLEPGAATRCKGEAGAAANDSKEEPMIRRLSLAGLVALIAALIPAGSAGAGSTCHEAPKPFDARTRVVPMEKLCFAPVVARVPRGATITWINRDPTTHTVTGVGGGWGSYDQIADGDRVSYSFDDEGVFPYFCFVHPGMSGAVVVGDGIGNGSSAPTLISGGGTDDSQGKDQSPTEPTSTASSTWPWLGALVAGSALALAWSQRRRLRGAEKPAS
jgi:plastocyanin